MAMIRCEMCDKFFDGDWVEMFENPMDKCSMVCIDCYTEWKEMPERIEALEEKLDAYDQYSICDCCESLTTDPVDCGGHQQCKSCTRIAALEAALDRIVKKDRNIMYLRCGDCANEVACDSKGVCKSVPLSPIGEMALAALKPGRGDEN